MLRVGTCGWSYDDWDGPVYPKGTAAGDRLKLYVERFPTVEIDSTFYRDPAPAVVKGWIQKTRHLERFEFSAKAPQDLTHDLLAHAPPEQCARRMEAWRALVAEPLAEAGRLGVVLMQLSPGVLHTRDAMARLDATLAALGGAPKAVEFRNRTWHDDAGAALKADALALLDRHAAAPVVTDGPGFPTIFSPSAAGHEYVRFHGRNQEAWFKRGVGRDERYDWRYDEDELAPFAERIALVAREKDVRVYFNNHVRGKAVENASTFEDMLAAQGAAVERAVSPQRRLF